MKRVLLVCVIALVTFKIEGASAQETHREVEKLATKYCFDCHDASSKKGGLDLESLLKTGKFDGELVFENVITSRMPPKDAEQPTPAERSLLLAGLAKRQIESSPNSYRRLSRHEFVHSVNDLLAIKLDIAEAITEDRGTNDFDSDRRIMLTKEMLGAYFSAADEMLDFALPADGFPHERLWKTSKIKDSHQTYNIYLRDYEDGLLFSWTRANNGNSYSFFYDNFEPPVKGWYDLTLDAAKVGDFDEDVSVLLYAGKYYFADDRPQPQRLLGVISLGDKNVKSYTLRGFLNPGENVSVHCYSKHTWRQKDGDQGAYIKQLTVRGPVLDQWPPRSYRKVFAGLPLQATDRKAKDAAQFQTTLDRIGGRIAVSSFQDGREKEKMQDGSNRTFWHTRFKPDVAEPPHYVILENPAREEITGLSYSTWSGGNGNGQVKEYSISLSDDGTTWGEPITAGTLEVRLAAEQPILFPAKTTKRFIKFLVTDAISLDGKSLASIGKLDVLVESATSSRAALPNATIEVSSTSKDDLKTVIRRFAENAFSSTLTEKELSPYYQASLRSLAEHGDFAQATKLGLKAVVCSHRFLLAPGEHRNKSYRTAADLARTIWLSIPDKRLLRLAESNSLSADAVPGEIERMFKDPRADRMIHSICDQWLNLRSFNKVSPSLKLYPTYNDLLNYYLPLETEAYVSHLIQENLPVSHLVDSDFSILNQRLAQHYGVEGVVGQEMRKVSFGPDTPRGGLLTMGSVLKVTSDGFQTSPILRGAWISKNIAGNTLSPPPESVEAIESDSSTATTLKEQIEEHKNNDSCYACHKSIDPYGFALENFDATGQWRAKYRIAKPHPGTFQFRRQGYYQLAGDVDASGEIRETEFKDVFGLKKILLSDHKKVAYNFAKKLFEYANGQKPTLQQRIDLHQMIPDKSDDCRMRDLVVDVLSYSFTGD